MNRRKATTIAAPAFAMWTPDRPAAAEPNPTDAKQITVSVSVSIHRGHCHRYAICQQEAPEIFELTRDGRLVYDARPPSHLLASLCAAARACPMQAISVKGLNDGPA